MSLFFIIKELLIIRVRTNFWEIFLKVILYTISGNSWIWISEQIFLRWDCWKLHYSIRELTLFSMICNPHYTGDRTKRNRINRGPPCNMWYWLVVKIELKLFLPHLKSKFWTDSMQQALSYKQAMLWNIAHYAF